MFGIVHQVLYVESKSLTVLSNCTKQPQIYQYDTTYAFTIMRLLLFSCFKLHIHNCCQMTPVTTLERLRKRRVDDNEGHNEDTSGAKTQRL